MRVLFDAYWWSDGPPSGRNVLRSLVLAWREEFPEDPVTLVVPHGRKQDVVSEVTGRDIEVIEYPRFAKVHAAAVLSLRVPSGAYDLVLTQNFGAPLVGSPTATLVHDAIFVTDPEWFTTSERAYLAALRPSLKFSDIVLTTSESETRRVGEVWPEVKGKLRAVGLAVPLTIARTAASLPALPIGPDRPFVLTVGRLNVRKNLRALVNGYAASELPARGTALLVVGEPDGLSDSVNAPEGVHFLQHVSDSELRWLYENCALFAFPSLDEGFGLPLVEAASLGATVVASDIPVFRELGVADAYFDPKSPEAIAAVLSSVRPTSRSRREPFTWPTVVGRIRAAVEGGAQAHRRGLNKVLNQKYVEARGIDSGLDPRLGDLDLVSFVAEKGISRLRAIARGYPKAFIGAEVRLKGRAHLQVGAGVSIGDGVLIDAASIDGVTLSDQATVDRGAIIRGSGGVRRLGTGVSIGRRAAVGAYNFIHGGGGVTIGDDVLLGPGVQVFSENHRIDDLTRPIIEQGEEPSSVMIGAGAWVGAGAIILAGVTVGAGAVVAAGAVVTKDVPPGSIAAGTPAKVIGWRSNEVPDA